MFLITGRKAAATLLPGSWCVCFPWGVWGRTKPSRCRNQRSWAVLAQEAKVSPPSGVPDCWVPYLLRRV